VTSRIKELAGKGCHVTFSENNVKKVANKSTDAYDVNLVMMDAYLDDGVDFFLLLFPHVRATAGRNHQQLPSRSLQFAVLCCQ